MNILVWIILGLLLIKIIWNLGVPYALMLKPIDPKTEKRGGISPMLEIEFILLIFATTLSWFTRGNSIINRPLAVLGWGLGTILVSYLHFFVGGVIAEWLLKRKTMRHPIAEDKAKSQEVVNDDIN